MVYPELVHMTLRKSVSLRAVAPADMISVTVSFMVTNIVFRWVLETERHKLGSGVEFSNPGKDKPMLSTVCSQPTVYSKF